MTTAAIVVAAFKTFSISLNIPGVKKSPMANKRGEIPFWLGLLVLGLLVLVLLIIFHKKIFSYILEQLKNIGRLV